MSDTTARIDWPAPTPGITELDYVLPPIISYNSINYAVTSIGDWVFYGSSPQKFTSITIPATVTSIGYNSIANIYNLTTVNILGNSLLTIGEGAFSNTNIITINLPNSLTTISKAAFAGTPRLTSINIPASVTSIGDFAFGGNNYRLTGIYVDPSNNYYSDISGVFFNKNKTICYKYPIGSPHQSFRVPEGVVTIEPGAFEFIGFNAGLLKYIYLPSTLNAINSGAFARFGAYQVQGDITIIFKNDPPLFGNNVFWYSFGIIRYPNTFTESELTTFKNKFVNFGAQFYQYPLDTSILSFTASNNQLTITGRYLYDIVSVRINNSTDASLNTINLNKSGSPGISTVNGSIIAIFPNNISGAVSVITATDVNGVDFICYGPPTISSATLSDDRQRVTIAGSWYVDISNVDFLEYNGTVRRSFTKSDTSGNNSEITINISSVILITPRVRITDISGKSSTIYFSQIINAMLSNVCFPAGTPIKCDQGLIDIEKINPDIHTIRGKKIVAITQTITPDKHIVCIEKNAFGKNIPSQQTLISKDHKVYYNRQMQKIKTLVGEIDGVKYVKYNNELLYNVLLDDHDKMVVNNLICETLHPDNGVAKLYRVLPTLTPEEQEELITELNHRLLERKINKTKNAAR
jgi:hypothetical protein